MSQVTETADIAAEHPGVSPAAPAFLELSGVNFRYPGPDGFTLEFDRLTLAGGEVVGLVGPSGNGKSTALHLAGLVEAPNPGATLRATYARGGEVVRFEADGAGGDDGRAAERFRHEAIGFIFQRPFLLPFLDAQGNVELPLRLARTGAGGASARRALAWLSAFGLGAKAGAYPADLSGGQAQRVAAARALASGAPFLLCDEPVSNLDEESRAAVLRALVGHARGGGAVLLVSHAREELARYCDRILVMHRGRLTFPFADRDDPDPSRPGPDGFPRPSLAPVALRDDAEVTRIVDVLSRVAVAADGGLARPARAVDAALRAPAPAPDPHAPLGFGRHAFAHAARQLVGRKQRLAALVVAALLAGTTAAASLALGLATGSGRVLRERTLGPDTFLEQFVVEGPSGPTGRVLTPAALERLARLPGLGRPPTPYEEVFSLGFSTASGRSESVGAGSVPAGDPLLAPVEPGRFATAQLGVQYVVGGPFAPGTDDQAGVLVSEAFLRESYFHLEEGQPLPPAPRWLELQLASDGGRWGAPAFSGRVRVPVVGVFRVPPLVEREGAAGLKDVMLPPLFLARLASWSPFDALRYTRTDGAPLADDHDLVQAVEVTVAGPARAGWADDPAVQEAAAAPFFPVRPGGGDALRLTLSPREQPDHRITPGRFLAEVWPRLKEVVEHASGGTARCRLTPVSARGVTPGITPASRVARSPSLAILRFRAMSDVPAAVAAVRADPALRGVRVDAPHEASIRRFEVVRGLLDRASTGVLVAYLGVLGVLVGFTAWMRVSARAGDVGVLRAMGLSPAGIAAVYRAELWILSLPACLAGLVLAQAIAWGLNDAVARPFFPEPEAPAAASPAPAARPPAVFRGLQQTPGEVAAEWLGVLACVAAVATAGGCASVALIRRQSIVQSLRAGGV